MYDISPRPSNRDTGYTIEEQKNSTLSVQTQVNTLIISNTTVSLYFLYTTLLQLYNTFLQFYNNLCCIYSGTSDNELPQ